MDSQHTSEAVRSPGEAHKRQVEGSGQCVAIHSVHDYDVQSE